MLPCEAQDPLGALRQEQGLAVLAAFFCLLFFAAAKKSRCRPAQGRRLNGKHRSADASENTSNPPSVANKTKPPNPKNYLAVYPPSIGKVTPVIIEAASLSKNKIGSATSRGSANRLSGIACNAGSRFEGSLHAFTAIGVKVTVGLMLFTRIPYAPSSTHKTRVIASIAALEAQ